MVPFHALPTQIGKDKVGMQDCEQTLGGGLPHLTWAGARQGCEQGSQGMSCFTLPIRTRGDEVGMQGWH